MPAAPADYYTGQAAASLLGVSRFTLNEWVELERQAPDALVLTASSSRRPQPAWSAETLQQWSRCTPGSPIQLLSPSAAISYTGLTPTTFNNWRARVEIPADATIHRSSTGTPKPVWTTTTLDLWLHKVSRHTRRRSPRATCVYTSEEAALLLGVAHPVFEKALQKHPLAPAAMMVFPAAQAWTADDLHAWAAEHLPAQGHAA
ncbi:hypothetical protein M3A88_09500 [Kocuria marina]|uniref:hypothetical protein n=1 Tax=Kocuria marina TaxID=223184 RepID=UPI002989A72A|nr:hypothetical protein [Kocuria marina]MCT1735471.1 hypothetical protein [Kocuria marina]